MVVVVVWMLLPISRTTLFVAMVIVMIRTYPFGSWSNTLSSLIVASFQHSFVIERNCSIPH